MSDSYIDYFEVGEYGAHFISEAKKLTGLSALVDIPLLISLVQTETDAVAAELGKAGITRSDARTSTTDVEAATAQARKEIDRFFHHLGSLDDDASFDLAAFFPGSTLGPLAALKPADVKAKADQVLLGFAAPANASLPEAAARKARLTKARDELADALVGKGSTRAGAIVGTAGLVAARQRFLNVYNGVAKKLVLGLLNSAGRGGEHALFFKDLQVNEGGSSKEVSPRPSPEPSSPPLAPSP